MKICAACVRARGLQAGVTSGGVRVDRVVDAAVEVGRCEDCGVSNAVLETWRTRETLPYPGIERS